MKYGEILDFRTKDKAVVGKKYVLSDIMFYISNSPENCHVGTLTEIEEYGDFPFSDRAVSFQFAREIIEEGPKYRPYKDTAELKADFFEDCPDMGKRYRPSIWVVSNLGSEYEISGFSNDGQRVFIYCAGGYTMENFFKDFKKLDGSPCGIKED